MDSFLELCRVLNALQPCLFLHPEQRIWGYVCNTGRMCMGCVLAGVHTGARGMPWGDQHIPRDLCCPTTYTTLLNTVGTCFWVTLKLPGTLFPAVIFKKASFLYLSYKNKTIAWDKSYFPLYSNLRWHCVVSGAELTFLHHSTSRRKLLSLLREHRIPDMSGAMQLISS